MIIEVVRKLDIHIYTTPSGKSPFIDWIESLQDKAARYRIKERLDRIALGNMGDSKSVHKGVSEIKFDFGPGYRLYFGKEGKKIILLCGGDKSSQKRDIKQAHHLWEDYLRR